VIHFSKCFQKIMCSSEINKCVSKCERINVHVKIWTALDVVKILHHAENTDSNFSALSQSVADPEFSGGIEIVNDMTLLWELTIKTCLTKSSLMRINVKN
jgi:hypothetical protein